MRSRPKIVLENPMLTKELRVRMRGSRTYWLLGGYLLILSMVLFFTYLNWWREATTMGSGFSNSSKVGQVFFWWIMGIQAFLVVFITPALTSGAITIEKEQRTLDILSITPLPRSRITAGKLVSALGFVALLLVSSMPLTSICFFLGGVSPAEVEGIYLLYMLVGLLVGALGLAWSSVAKTTASAVVLTYACVSAVLLGVFIVGSGGVLGMAFGRGVGTNVGSNVGLIMVVLSGIGCVVAGAGGGPAVAGWLGNGITCFGVPMPLWVPPLVLYLLAAALFHATATVRIETFPERKAWIPRGLVLACVVAFCFFMFGGLRDGLRAVAGPASPIGNDLYVALVFPVLLLLFCAPVFTTGEAGETDGERPAGSRMLGWSPRALLRGELGSGLPFMLLLTVVVLGMFYAALLMPGRWSIWAPGLGQSMRWLPVVNQFLPVCVTVLVSVLGFSAIGIAASVATRNRWAAIGASYAMLIFLLAAPAIACAQATAAAYDTPQPGLMANLIYLNPLYYLLTCMAPVRSNPSVHLWFDGPMPWMGTVFEHLFLVLICVAMALTMRSWARSLAERPRRATALPGSTPNPPAGRS